MALAEWGAAALGALISGIIGVIAVEYRSQRTVYNERRQWYDRLIRLAERAERAVVDTDEENARDDTPRGSSKHGEIEHLEVTHGVVSSELHQHIGKAPPTVSSQLLEQAEEVARETKHASENASPSRDSMTYIGTHFETAAEQAGRMKRMAEDERQSVGFLWL